MLEYSATYYLKCYIENSIDNDFDGNESKTWDEFFQDQKERTYDYVSDLMSLNPTDSERNKVAKILTMKDGQFSEEKKIWKERNK